jgi:hypothetical protein
MVGGSTELMREISDQRDQASDFKVSIQFFKKNLARANLTSAKLTDFRIDSPYADVFRLTVPSFGIPLGAPGNVD